MAKWKLVRDICTDEEYTLVEGKKVTVGRGLDNTISLPSLMVSRHHCVIEVLNGNLFVTDLKSSNGTYVGVTKIPQNIPSIVEESDMIGFGWIDSPGIQKISDEDKYVFKLIKLDKDERTLSVIHRIEFQNDDNIEDIKKEIAALSESKSRNSPILMMTTKPNRTDIEEKSVKDVNITNKEIESTTIPNSSRIEENSVKNVNITFEENKSNVVVSKKLSLKRKTMRESDKMGPPPKKECSNISENFNKNVSIHDEVINLLSDSDEEIAEKNIKIESTVDRVAKNLEKELKEQPENIDYDAFQIKQRLSYDEEPISLDSDSDSESEQWFIRLSQSSPGKPFIKMNKEKPAVKQEETSYSQLEDVNVGDFLDSEEESKDDNNEEDFDCDIISFPSPPKELPYSTVKSTDTESNQLTNNKNIINDCNKLHLEEAELIPDLITLDKQEQPSVKDTSDIFKDAKVESIQIKNTVKKTKLIEYHEGTPRKHKSKSGSHSSSKKDITNSLKEERKRKLKEIATKEKDLNQDLSKNLTTTNSTKYKVKAKNTSSNRGAFLADVPQTDVKSVKKKSSSHKSVKSDKKKERIKDSENKKKHAETHKDQKSKLEKKKETEKEKESSKISLLTNISDDNTDELRVPLKAITPFSESKTVTEKPVSKVEPLQYKKLTKKVRFTEEPPQVQYFEIQFGNKMKKTSSIKTALVDARHIPVFSLEKVNLMKILRWNPQWLEEQLNLAEPPPILGHNNPMAILHFFKHHRQYTQLVGDLLLMEIWECLTQAYNKIRNQTVALHMTIQSIPPVPTNERFDLLNINVTFCIPKNTKHDTSILPRVGEVLFGTFGVDSTLCHRFFFVHNVRQLPTVPNMNAVYSISLNGIFTERMIFLKQGDAIAFKRLAYINNELNLFEAMENLGDSPLCEAILRPHPRHFPKPDSLLLPNLDSKWTSCLNESQRAAVSLSVAAALSDRPSIQMVQGPPGTGKSSVICSIVMSYFYDSSGKKLQNRGKILICATSNPAVDELVLRLLSIRQGIPKPERFRMVRVGRAEAMHPQAYPVSSQQLAQRDAQRLLAEPVHPASTEEIAHLEAKINMYMTSARDSTDPGRTAYFEGKISHLRSRIALMRGGEASHGMIKNGSLSADRLVAAEKWIVECADIIVTTLASAHNHKLRGLKRRIALCIVDEAGQAIEPETLIPLTLDVTHMTLVGDPQQLPGYICSQRAKLHGLGESLFARLSSCSEHWEEINPVILLNQQYRMHEQIADYPNRAFYESKVISCGPPRPHLPVPPYMIIGISSGDRGQGTSGGNEMEAWGAGRLAAAVYRATRELSLSVAIITPYNGHKELLKRYLRTLLPSAPDSVEVNTVDSFQGQERDIVIVSLARSHGVGFLTDTGRMNVMLTRAKHALLICLNPNALLKNQQWRTLVDDAQQRNVFRMLPSIFSQPPNSTQCQDENIFNYIK